MTGSAAVEALAAAGALGPFFAVAPEAGPGWVSWTALVDGGPLEQRIADVRAALAAAPGAPDVDRRVAASLAHLGLVARLLSPVLGAALVRGVLPVAAPEEVHLHLAGANPLPLALPAAGTVPAAGPDALAGALDRCWLVPAVQPLSAAVAACTGLSTQVLDGNTISAVAGALRMANTAVPELAPLTAATLDAVLAEGTLAGTGARRGDGSFVRRSCCLFYRLPGAGTCGDCVLTRPGPGASRGV
ncbi:(2Fe-2S)-binding protein [Geodermatophilus sp. SYSU D00965]